MTILTVSPPAVKSGRSFNNNSITSTIGRWQVQAERAKASHLSCAAIRDRIARLVLVPEAVLTIAGLALVAIDRAEYGCEQCGALVSRPDGRCRQDQDGAA